MLSDLVTQSLATLGLASWNLVPPALFFLTLGLVAKGPAFWGDLRLAARESALNLQILGFNVLLVVPLITLASQAMTGFFDHPGRRLLEPSTWTALPPALVIVIAVFWGDLVGYWRHRLEHSPLLWPSHAIHHSDTAMTWLSLERFHPINRLTTFAIDGAALLILGFPPEAVLANFFVRHYYGFFIHANLPWTYGKLGLLLVSPAMHRWHHAADPKAYNTNFATVFSLFDRALGTFRVPGPCEVPLGVTDKIAPTLAGQTLHPLRPSSYRRLFRKR